MTGSDPRDLKTFLDRCREIVDRVGWMIQGVMVDPPWYYTAGLTRFEHPEFAIVVGLAPELAQEFLNMLGERVKAGERFEDGQVLNDLVGIAVTLRACVTDGERPFSIATQLHPDRVVYGLQVVFPDHAGNFPWNPGYSMDSQVLLPRPGNAFYQAE